MAGLIDDSAQAISGFSSSYIIPYLPILVIALLTVILAYGLSGRRSRYRVRMALRAEMRSNINVTKAILTYADSQLSGQMSEDEKEMVHFLPELLNSFAKCPSCSRSFFEIEEGRSVRLIEVVFDD